MMGIPQRFLFCLVVLLFGVCGSIADASAPKRLVDFEWEPTEEAAAYEVEIQQTKTQKKYQFKVSSSSWNGKLAPGQYTIRLRALDRRGVPGEWSDVSPFPVGLESTTLLAPQINQELRGEGSETNVNFHWKNVPAATSYELTVKGVDDSFEKKVEISEAKTSMTLPSAKKFKWTVRALGPENLASDDVVESQFAVLGLPLETPQIYVPENGFVRDISWKPPQNAESFDVVLSRQDPKTKKWNVIQRYDKTTQLLIPFDRQWPGGQYRVAVRAQGGLYPASAAAHEKFSVRAGDRSPAAEYNAEVRKSIDRVDGWYGIASYLVTEIKYSAYDYDPQSPLGTTFSAVGGTGRAGIGYFRENTRWGMLSILDLSGFLDQDGHNRTFASAEISGVFRQTFGDLTELRVQLGPYYKEQQVARGQVNSGLIGIRDFVNVGMTGAHLGAEYWVSISPKIGIQVNTHLYLPLNGRNVPNGQAIKSPLSSQFGFLGSYRFNRKFTGLAGYAIRNDKIEYGSDPANAAYSGKTNSSTLKGNYFNLYAEYAF